MVKYLTTDVHNVVSKRPDITKAKRDLGHRPIIPLSVGIPKTIEWYKQVYYRNDVTTTKANA